jgi:uncharacterized FlaG/YvyC family protein
VGEGGLKMEITKINDNAVSLSLQGLITGSVKKPGQRDEQAGQNEVSKELLERVSKGDAEAIKGFVESVNQIIKAMYYNIQFIVDRETGGVIVKVVDREGNLIRRIPPEGLASFSSETAGDLGLLLNREL